MNVKIVEANGSNKRTVQEAGLKDDHKYDVTKSNKLTVQDTGPENDLESDSEDENVVHSTTISRPTQGVNCPNKLYGVRVKNYQLIFLAKGVHNGRAVYTFPFEESLRKSLEKAKEYEVVMIGVRRSGEMNMAMKLAKLGKNGSTVFVNQIVFVRKINKGSMVENTTESLKAWAQKLIHGIYHQECQYRVPVVFQADITQLDNSNQLLSADSVLMDEDVVRLVNARYRSKVSSGEFFQSENRVRTFFSNRRSVEEIKMLFL